LVTPKNESQLPFAHYLHNGSGFSDQRNRRNGSGQKRYFTAIDGAHGRTFDLDMKELGCDFLRHLPPRWMLDQTAVVFCILEKSIKCFYKPFRAYSDTGWDSVYNRPKSKVAGYNPTAHQSLITVRQSKPFTTQRRHRLTFDREDW
jgi:hypothetical protein